MLYKDFIKVDEEFQYSINLQYDLNKLTKVDGYIPTSLSVEILMKFLKNIVSNSKDRSTVLIGPYGKGKSHLLLVLSAIVSLGDEEFDVENKISAKSVLKRLIDKIGNINNDAKEAILSIRSQKKRLLPIIVNSSYIDLNQSFLIALKDALEREGLIDLVPNTYFQAVKSTIKVWESQYQDTYRVFEQKLSDNGLSIEQFNGRLDKFDSEVYEIFKIIHPQITSGTIFNPLVNSDVVKLYEEVNLKICESGNFGGMFIVFDEFSKFLEASIDKNVSRDIKILQDFAELANRSGDNQIHLTCITHKAVNDYIANLTQDKIDAWRAIEGRFKEIYFTSSSEQNYELIANAIKKDNRKFDVFLSDFQGKFRQDIDQCGQLGLFRDIENYEDKIVKGCFPLNPTSAYVLPRVSEKVAQNERTLFTFLARDEKGSLARFISENTGNLNYLTLDWIYDYFEVLFKKEIFNQSIHSIWVKTSTLLGRMENITEKKIIKALAVIYIVNELHVLSPRDKGIKAALSLQSEEYDQAISSLLTKEYIRKNPSNNFYVFRTEGSENVSKEILSIKETKAANIDISKALRDVVDLGFLIPKRYNDSYEMTRFFKNIFMTANELENISNGESLINYHQADGVIINLLYKNNEEKFSSINKIKDLNCKRLLACIPDKPFEKQDELREFVAIQYLKNDENYRKQNELLEQVLIVYEEDLGEAITRYIEQNYLIQYGKCKYYSYDGLEKNVVKSSHISKKVSEICEKVFGETPIINNEMINKRNPSSQIVKARSKVIEYMFEEMDNQDSIGLAGSGPDATLYRALIKNKLLHGPNKRTNDENLNTILVIIEDFIRSTENNKTTFVKLYNILCGEKYGLRSGVIPVYLAFIMRQFKEYIVIYLGDKEVPLTVDTINAINNNPKQYHMILESGTNEKDEYINTLEKMFKEYSSSRRVGYNRYSNILISMQNWMQSLPKYSREYEIKYTDEKEEKVEKDIVVLRKDLLKFEINPREFLLERLQRKILREDSFSLCIQRLESIKSDLDGHLNLLLKTLVNRTKEAFYKGYNGELSTLLNRWYKNLSETSKKHAYDSITNKVLNYIATLSTYNDEEIIRNFAYSITGLDIEDWSDDMFSRYSYELAKFIEKVNNYKDEVVVDENVSYELTFFKDGKKIEKAFDAEPISALGTTLLDDIEQSIEEYADSLDINEKRSILMELIKRFM